MSSAALTLPKSKFVLYVADETSNSQLAVNNLTAICRQYLSGRYEIEIVNVFDEPKRALADRIFMTPLVMRLSPAPVRRIVGTLSQREKVLGALGLDASAP